MTANEPTYVSKLPLDEFGDGRADVLMNAGYETTEDLRRAKRHELRALPGIGTRTLDRIMQWQQETEVSTT